MTEATAEQDSRRISHTACVYDPPRFLWMRRITCGTFALIVLILALWGSATLIAKYRLDQLIASYRAAGEPVFAKDFNTRKGIPNEANAATYYKRAMAAYAWPKSYPGDVSDFDLIEAVLFESQDPQPLDVEHFINTNGEVIELLKTAAQCKNTNWNLSFAEPILSTAYSDVLPTRRLAKLLSVAIGLSHRRGRSDEAFDLLIVQFQLAKNCAAVRRGLVDHFVATSIAELSVDVVENLGARLQIGSEQGSVDGSEASRGRVRALIEMMLDDSAFSDSLSAGIRSERGGLINTLDFLETGNPIPFVFTGVSPYYVLLIQPVMDTDARRIAEHISKIAVASEYASYVRTIHECPNPMTISVGRFLEEDLPDYIREPAYEPTINVDYARRARRKMAAIALAIRLFELDHGKRPTNLHELVPSYLETVPIDPYVGGDSVIQYLPNAESPILYSRGRDSTDNGGKYTFRDSGYVDGDKLDLVFFLNGDRPYQAP